MSAKTKIIVLHAKELIMAGILAAFGLLLILLFILLILPKNPSKNTGEEQTLPTPSYQPGIYKAQLRLGNQLVEVETILESDRIASVRLTSLDEVITTAYPLLKPTMESICEQVCEKQSLEDVKIESSARYTSLALLSAIKSCLEKGKSARQSAPSPSDE